MAAYSLGPSRGGHGAKPMKVIYQEFSADAREFSLRSGISQLGFAIYAKSQPHIRYLSTLLTVF
jgi:hypothetical protein